MLILKTLPSTQLILAERRFHSKTPLYLAECGQKLLDSAGYRHIFITYSAETTFCANDYDKKQKFRFLIQKKNVSGELDRNSTCSILEHMANDNYICKVNALRVSTIPLLQNAISPISSRTIYRPPCYEYPTSGHFTFSGIPPFHTAPRHITQKAICRNISALWSMETLP